MAEEGTNKSKIIPYEQWRKEFKVNDEFISYINSREDVFRRINMILELENAVRGQVDVQDDELFSLARKFKEQFPACLQPTANCTTTNNNSENPPCDTTIPTTSKEISNAQRDFMDSQLASLANDFKEQVSLQQTNQKASRPENSAAKRLFDALIVPKPSQDNRTNNVTPSSTGKSPSFGFYYTEEQVETGLKNNTLKEGILYVNPHALYSAYVVTCENDVYNILGMRARNQAFDGDQVVVRMLHKSSSDSQVVYIRQKNRARTFVGILSVLGPYIFFCPTGLSQPIVELDYKALLGMGFILENNIERLYEVAITKWTNLKNAEGKVVRCFGNVLDLNAETEFAFKQFGCERDPFPDGYKSYYPNPLTFKITSVDFDTRENFSDRCTFTIDPLWAAERDDALSVKMLENGNFEVGIHIADVSYFFKPDTPFDDAVRKRAATVYFDYAVYNMLPDDLVDLVTLTAGQDRLTFSVIWEITSDGDIVSSRFSKTIINSCAQFTYDNVMILLEKGYTAVDDSFPPIYNEFTIEDCTRSINILNNIAQKLNLKRSENWYLDIRIPEVRFTFEENDSISKEIIVTTKTAADKIVEEFMVLANLTVGQKIHEVYPNSSLLRVHSKSDIRNIESLGVVLDKHNVPVDVSSDIAFFKSISLYVDKPDVYNVLVKIVASNFLKAAKYCNSDSGELYHFGLNASLYTHFTSPIRGYANLVVHRLLDAALQESTEGAASSESTYWTPTPSYINSLASYLNATLSKHDYMNHSMTKTTLRMYLKKFGPKILKCLVYTITEKYICLISTDYNFGFKINQRDLLKTAVRKERVDGSVRVEWIKGTIQTISLFSQVLVKQSLEDYNVISYCLLPSP